MAKILQKDSKKLRKKSQAVSKSDFGSKSLKTVIRQMEGALESQGDGVALAAPQIGVNLRIFMVSWKVYATLDGINTEELDEEELEKVKNGYVNKVFINPEITKTSKEDAWMEEGCLSVRSFYGKVLRAKKCRVRATDAEGKNFEVGGSGIMAQIFQHEIDHLNGVLFTDKARDVKEMEEFHSVKKS